MNPLFSVLIPSIFERMPKLQKLVGEFERQIQLFDLWDSVQIVSVVDNRKVSIGTKRQQVLNCSIGNYVAFVDDDDEVSNNYLFEVVNAIRNNDVDVITFDNCSIIEDHDPIIVNMRLRQENEQVRFEDGSDIPVVIRRAAWHTCAWRSSLAKTVNFPDLSYGEDWEWARQLNTVAKTEFHIPQVLHTYIFKKSISRAVA